MKALSIRQPWAWLIVHGHKNIENRTWRTSFRGRIYVHAGKVIDHAAFPECHRYLREAGHKPPYSWEMARGAIVGEVTIVDCVSKSDSPVGTVDWFEGPYGFVLTDPIPYDIPIPYAGRLGLFDVVLPPGLQGRTP